MSSPIAEYLPVIRQAAKVNAILVLYFIMPNFSSFILTAVLAVTLLAPQLFKQMACCDQENSKCSFNHLFKAYLQSAQIRKLVVVVVIGVVAQLTYFLPSWLIVLIAAQIIAFYDLLVSFGVVELSASFLTNTETAIGKFLSLIPKYQQ